MTVCVATISGSDMVICAADRMLATASTAYEPATGKVWQITNSIYALPSADDITIQAAIAFKVREIVKKRIEADQANWWLVADVAELWRASYADMRDEFARTKVLEPLGLTYASLIQLQRVMAPRFLDSVVTGLEATRYNYPGVATLIVGCDSRGAHIYSVDNAEPPSCHTSLGFASVGSGALHASSQLMRAPYDPTIGLFHSCLLTYTAKRRADQATPTVGRALDMCLIGPKLGASFFLKPFQLDRLDKIYNAMVTAESDAFLAAINAATQWGAEVAVESQGQPQDQPATATLPTPPSDPGAGPQSPPESKDGP